MPNCLIDHPLVQDTNNTAPRWSRFFGDTISEWIESAVQEWKDDTKRNGHFKMSFWGCFDPIDLFRKEGNIGGTLVRDCCKVWCCNCCSLIQNEKESTILLGGRSAGLGGGDGAVESQYTGGARAGDEMVMEPQGLQKGIDVAGAGETWELRAVSEIEADGVRQAVDIIDQTNRQSSPNVGAGVKNPTPHALTSDHEKTKRPTSIPDIIDTQTRDHSFNLPTATESPTINLAPRPFATNKRNHDLPIRRLNSA
ncbi:hypothetical protein DDE83_000673 [Stemphylium lycopersici]|uniref:Uncharacterized protein n=1 Tax=Stemphylium lycopersici TaxID=183478 RepID=A0A364NF30_STELY|nr:hypothetical protein DDE83_000673 [Stemphylium lycopersici]